MKRFLFHCSPGLVASVVMATAGTATAALFHVAPGGDNTDPGTAQKPLATLEAARDAARRAGAGPHRIVVMPGEYFLERPVELDARVRRLGRSKTNATLSSMGFGEIRCGFKASSPASA